MSPGPNRRAVPRDLCTRGRAVGRVGRCGRRRSTDPCWACSSSDRSCSSSSRALWAARNRRLPPRRRWQCHARQASVCQKQAECPAARSRGSRLVIVAVSGDGEEVTHECAGSLSTEELGPRWSRSSRCRPETVTPQETAHARLRNGHTQLYALADDAQIALRWGSP